MTTAYVLFPLSESGFLGLDLLCELLPQLFFLLLELGVVELFGLGLAEFAGLHLCLSVVLVVEVLRCRDEVKHVRSDEQRAQLFEVTVVLVLDWVHVSKGYRKA